MNMKINRILFSFPLLFFAVNSLISQSTVTDIRFGSTGDPLTGIAISWNSDGAADSIAWGYTAELEKGSSLAMKSSSITGTRFEYIFPALEGGQAVYYAVFDSHLQEWTGNSIYTTASGAPGDQFSFTVLGDSRSYPAEWQTISEAALDTDFTLFMGDIVNDGNVASDWQDWFDYGEVFVGRELIYHCVGNHDDDNSASGFDNFLGLYTLPGNELYYSFTYGNAVFICLNSEEASDADQYNWLLTTLETHKDKTWKIVFFHKPFYTAPSHTGEMDAYFNTWWKAFDDYGVDLIFNGHTHNYQRTVPINRNVSTSSGVASYGSGEGMGRCQIVAGNAGAPESNPASSSFWWLEHSVKGRHFVDVQIDGDQLSLKAMYADHTVFDELTLDKSRSDITFNVNLGEVSDLYEGGAVWLVFGDRDSVVQMTDVEGDHIFSYSLTEDIDKEIEYSFSYQTGPDPETDYTTEVVPEECANAMGYRIVTVPYGAIDLPAVLYGTCSEAPVDITFQVDLAYITDLYSGGAVWILFNHGESSYEMTESDTEHIYSLTLPFLPGTDLTYVFSYQSGADPDVDYIQETVSGWCSDPEGNRVLKVPDTDQILPAYVFNACILDPGPTSSLTIPILYENDDGEEVMTSLEEAGPLGQVDLTSSDLELTFDHEPQYVGMLFRDVQLLREATIETANIKFQIDVVADGVTDADLSLTIYGAKEPHVDALTGYDFDISSHPSTDATVAWSPEPSVRVGDPLVTSDISTIISEIISQDDWAPGNNILIVITGDPNQTTDRNREVEAGPGSDAPTLNIYAVNGSTLLEDTHAESFKIFPNPAQGKLYIEHSYPDIFSIDIYTVSGKLVTRMSDISGSSAEIDISSLRHGNYFMHLRSSERSEVKQFIVASPGVR
jgi:hypothetical protein